MEEAICYDEWMASGAKSYTPSIPVWLECIRHRRRPAILDIDTNTNEEQILTCHGFHMFYCH